MFDHYRTKPTYFVACLYTVIVTRGDKIATESTKRTPHAILRVKNADIHQLMCDFGVCNCVGLLSLVRRLDLATASSEFRAALSNQGLVYVKTGKMAAPG